MYFSYQVKLKLYITNFMHMVVLDYVHNIHPSMLYMQKYRAFKQQLYLKYKQVPRIYIPYRINAFCVITLWKISLAYKI